MTKNYIVTSLFSVLSEMERYNMPFNSPPDLYSLQNMFDSKLQFTSDRLQLIEKDLISTYIITTHLKSNIVYQLQIMSYNTVVPVITKINSELHRQTPRRVVMDHVYPMSHKPSKPPKSNRTIPRVKVTYIWYVVRVLSFSSITL